MICDDTIHAFADLMASKTLRWRDSDEEGVQYYYAEDRLYVVRDTRVHPHRFALFYADSPATAIRWLIGEEAKGQWLNGNEYEYEYAYCSECGRMQWAGWDSHSDAREKIGDFHKEYKFCPGCGAKMEGGCYVE